MRSRTSPDFDRPPLVETVLGVQFDPLAQLRLSHLVSFLHSRGIDPGKIREDRAIGQTVEPASKDEIWVGKTLRIDLSDSPALRLLAHEQREDGARLVQIENGWLISNWQSPGGNAPYPRYKRVRPEFEEWRRDLAGFLVTSGLGKMAPNLWEVSYVNVIPRGDLWDDVSQWHEVLPGLLSRGPSVKCGPLQTTSGRWVIDLAPHKARLQILVEHARRGSPDQAELLVVKLIARGRVEGESEERLAEGLDLGHETIVHTFVELASKRALSYWGYRG